LNRRHVKAIHIRALFPQAHYNLGNNLGLSQTQVDNLVVDPSGQ